MNHPTPRSPLFPYTTLFRSVNVVVATVDPELGHRGQASFIVPKDTPGLSQGKKEDKLGIRASQTAEIVLEDCRIRSEEHTSELQSHVNIVCRLLLEKKKSRQ